jgi:hypothetical protein
MSYAGEEFLGGALRCALLELQSDLDTHKQCLPQAPVEPPCIILLPQADFGVGSVAAPPCSPSSALSVKCLAKRVHPGRAATFILAPPYPAPCGTHESVLDALSAVTTVDAAVCMSCEGESVADTPHPPLPVFYEPSTVHGGVVIRIPIPPAVKIGAVIAIRRAFIAGNEVALGESPVQAIVGFNHATTQDTGLLQFCPVYTAALNGNLPDLMRFLEDGASTEEADAVSCV